jgi:hypothetical protein
MKNAIKLILGTLIVATSLTAVAQDYFQKDNSLIAQYGSVRHGAI